MGQGWDGVKKESKEGVGMNLERFEQFERCQRPRSGPTQRKGVTAEHPPIDEPQNEVERYARQCIHCEPPLEVVHSDFLSVCDQSFVDVVRAEKRQHDVGQKDEVDAEFPHRLAEGFQGNVKPDAPRGHEDAVHDHCAHKDVPRSLVLRLWENEPSARHLPFAHPIRKDFGLHHDGQRQARLPDDPP